MNTNEPCALTYRATLNNLAGRTLVLWLARTLRPRGSVQAADGTGFPTGVLGSLTPDITAEVKPATATLLILPLRTDSHIPRISQQIEI